MTKTPEEFVKQELDAGRLTTKHIVRLVREFQTHEGLEVDGKPGPMTRAALDKRNPANTTWVNDGWLCGPRIESWPIHNSWFGGNLKSTTPKGVVCHVSATNPGAAINMAKRRQRVYGTDKNDRLTSWHLSVEADGSIVQMLPFTKAAWHAGSPTARAIPGIGHANYYTIGIELIGWEKGPFPQAQVEAYARALRAIVQAYGIPRQYAMITHSSIDPSRRTDPGGVWMREHAEAVLDTAYQP
jgi:peptidoglycan hydrolase-like protein with peptidoglycan-binding domain